jgi:ribonuclease HI
MAPNDWYEQHSLTVRFRYDRPDLTTLNSTPPDLFTWKFDATKPIFIETDGACSGNQGAGGWVFIITQEDRKVEAYGANAHTSNNETELKAIEEALSFFPAVKAYVVIESDSQSCLDMMTEKGAQWQADNFIKLTGDRVKNKEFVDSITNKLRVLNVQFRKVKGHSNDQWNDSVDTLAVRGRNEALDSPKCPFEIIMQGGWIPFSRRVIRESIGSQELCTQLSKETHIKIPTFRELNVSKDGSAFSGLWTSGHCQLVLKSLPPPAAQALPEASPLPKSPLATASPVRFAVYDGKKFVPIPPIDVSKTTESERLDIFNSVCPSIGREVRINK